MMKQKTVCSKFPYTDAVITGASSGIGTAFITTIRDCNKSTRLCNISRSEGDDFSQHGVRHCGCDLADPKARAALATQLCGELEAAAGPLLLINNAGFGSYGNFAENDISHELQMLEVNCAAMLDLTYRLLPALRARGGAIINVASTAAWQPTPYLASYGATKAFVLHWSLALREELKPHRIAVMALCPGPTESRFFQRAGFDQPPLAGKGQTAEQVARFAIKALARNAACPVSGLSNKLLVSLSHALPKRWQAIPAGAILRRVRAK
jgi:short-subunit dehydrogenase